MWFLYYMLLLYFCLRKKFYMEEGTGFIFWKRSWLSIISESILIFLFFQFSELAGQSMVCRLAAWVSPGHLLDKQNPRPVPDPEIFIYIVTEGLGIRIIWNLTSTKTRVTWWQKWMEKVLTEWSTVFKKKKKWIDYLKKMILVCVPDMQITLGRILTKILV